MEEEGTGLFTLRHTTHVHNNDNIQPFKSNYMK